MNGFELYRDYKRDNWVLKDLCSNETVLVSKTTKRINNYIKMKNKLKENGNNAETK